MKNILLLVLANLIWAAQPTAVKYISGDVLGPFAIAFLPFFAITPLLVPLLWWRRPGEPTAARPTPRDWMRFTVAGIGGQLVAQLGMTWGSVVGQASSCAILYLLIPVITAVLASLLLGERVTRLRMVCLAIGLAGVLLMSAKDLGNLSLLGHGYLLGNLLFLGGCLGASFYNVYCKGLMERFPDRDILIYSYITATVASLPFLLWREPGSFQGLFRLDTAGWLAFGFLTLFVYGLSMLMLFHVLHKLPVTVVLASTYLVPVFGVVIAMLFLGERLDLLTATGAAVVLAATVLVMRYDAEPGAGRVPSLTAQGCMKRFRGLWMIVVPVLAFAHVCPGQEPADTNYDESKVAAYDLPDPLVCFDGQQVSTATLWRERRRPEIVAAFAEHVFGRTPDIATNLRRESFAADAQVFDGLATRRQVRLRFLEGEDAPWIDVLMYVPCKTRGRPPVFLGLNYGNQGVAPDQGIVPSRNSVCRRGEHSSRWPLRTILERGYAVACFHGGDVELDPYGSGCHFTTEGSQTGIRHFVMRQEGRDSPADDDWGSIGVWSWALSRVLDSLRSDPCVDGDRVAVFGHSRTGKAALWAGAQDERFAMVISNESGQGGASLARRRYGETVAASCSISGSWYCGNYRKYGDNEVALPVDAHLLIAAIAPRPVYVASAEQDRWCDPHGEFLAARHAEPVYRLFGLAGLGGHEMPPVNHPVGETIGYHVREGDHDITLYDWERFLDFADKHLSGD